MDRFVPVQKAMAKCGGLCYNGACFLWLQKGDDCVIQEYGKPDLAEQHATRAIFFVGGFGAASWAPLVPLLKARLGIAEDVLGMLLLCIGIGSLLTMPLSGAAAVRLGCRRVLTAAGLVYGALLLALCTVSSFQLAIPLLLIFGATMGCIDVVVNIQAVIVEKAAGRRLMSGMHALWSVGGFAGAGLFGIWVGTFSLTPLASTGIAAAVMVLVTLAASRHLLPYGGDAGGKLLALPKGIVTFVGIIACIAFLVEGAIMDWGGVFLTTVRHFNMALAGTGFTVFSAAMLTMRLLGDWTVQKLGQERVVTAAACSPSRASCSSSLRRPSSCSTSASSSSASAAPMSCLSSSRCSANSTSCPSASLCQLSVRSAISASSWGLPPSALSPTRRASTLPSRCSPHSSCCRPSSRPTSTTIS